MQEVAIRYPILQLYKSVTSGRIKGDTLIDVSMGPMMHLLCTVSDVFKEITILKFNDECIKEVKKWLDTHSECFDWSHTSKYIMELNEGGSQIQEREEELKSKIKHIVKCDIEKENITDPVILPKSDCLLSVTVLEAISEDHEEFRKNLKKIVSLLKPGGQLLLFTALDATFYRLGEHKFRLLKCDETFVRSVLHEQGFVIEYIDWLKKPSETHLTDFNDITFVIARKPMEV
ncbi:nicotinamide N-methyltransferase-like [Pelobates cultripes]|uniref:Nicotinamide N-methyltransferase-like n=1 Tax=Pelobates cultripes TaxID=61616 RepID=A0AAD1T6W9_PELCU|nr:nicotinamide N-methyltransferase-like [Pelobates cultripes]